MHHAAVFGAAALLLTTVTAIPYKRDVEIQTVTQIDIETVEVTSTVWVDPTDAPDAHADYHSALVVETTHGGVGYHKHSHAAPTSSSTPAPPPPPPPAPTTSSTTVVAAPPTTQIPAPPTTQAPAPAPPTTSSIYVAPAPVSVYVPPPPPPAPTTTTPAPVPTTTAQPTPQAAPTTASSGSPSGTTYSGDITYYDVGLGSCGSTNSDSDFVVAMSAAMMNKATMCGKSITLSYGGITQTATVVDTCPGCASGGLDLSPALFKAIAPNGDGRVHDVKWWFN